MKKKGSRSFAVAENLSLEGGLKELNVDQGGNFFGPCVVAEISCIPHFIFAKMACCYFNGGV